MFAREKHKATFLLSYFSVTKSTKSHLRGLSSLLKNTFRVHELVARAMRGKCVRQMAKLKSTMSYFPQPHTTTRANISHEEAEQIRARIVCTPAESAGRAWGSLCADGTIKINPISLCSHQDTHPNLNREVCHSPTWHSSKSESALERFEPVAVVQQLRDGRGTLFARVAARRQKVFKRGIDTYAEHVCRRRRDGSQFLPLFVLFGQAKRTLKDKYHKVTFLLSYFSVTKRRVQGGVATSERRRRDRVRLVPPYR